MGNDNDARDVARTNLRATIWSALIGVVGVVAAAWIGSAVGRNQGRDQRVELQNVATQRSTQIAQRDAEVARLKSDVQGFQQRIDQLSQQTSTSKAVAPTPPPPVMSESLPKREAEGVVIHLAGCAGEGTTVICDMFITSKAQDREVLLAVKQESGIRRTGICFSRGVDLAANEFIAIAVTLGNKPNEDNGQITSELVADINTPVRVTFQGVRPQGARWALLELCGAAPKAFHVQFRDVPITY